MTLLITSLSGGTCTERDKEIEKLTMLSLVHLPDHIFYLIIQKLDTVDGICLVFASKRLYRLTKYIRFKFNPSHHIGLSFQNNNSSNNQSNNNNNNQTIFKLKSFHNNIQNTLQSHRYINILTNWSELDDESITHVTVKLPLPPFNKDLDRVYVSTLTVINKQEFKLEPNTIPSCVKTLIFDRNFNVKIEPNVIPPTVRSIIFGSFYNHEIVHGVVPHGVQEIEFGHRWNKVLEPESLPSSVISIKFGMLFKQKLNEISWPPSLCSLDLGGFNGWIEPGSIPSSVKNLKLGHTFNQFLYPGSFPHTIESLELGYNFNTLIQHGVLPTSLITLRFGSRFDQPITPGLLPNSIKHLYFGKSFSSHLPIGCLPPNLETLKLGKLYYGDILSSKIIPDTVTNLSIKDTYMYDIDPYVLPSNLTKFMFPHRSLDQVRQVIQQHNINLTPYLTSILNSLNYYLNQLYKERSLSNSSSSFNQNNQTKDLIPSSFYKMVVNSKINDNNEIPPSVQKLVFTNRYRLESLPNTIPKHVKELKIDQKHDQKVAIPLSSILHLDKFKFTYSSISKTTKIIQIRFLDHPDIIINNDINNIDNNDDGEGSHIEQKEDILLGHLLILSEFDVYGGLIPVKQSNLSMDMLYYFGKLIKY